MTASKDTGPTRGGTVLAFDFGTKRIGVAVGDTSVGLPHPLMTIASDPQSHGFPAIEALIREWQPAFLVVGLPTHSDGSEHDMTARARRFARRLEGRFAISVAMVDERYTTQEAGSVLRESGLDSRGQRRVRDQVAAQLILQAYFDQHPAGPSAP